jgi:hypothetical protein
VKQAIVARADLGMGAGKLAAQVAHASLSAYEDADERSRRAWKGEGQKKVVLQGDGEAELFELAGRGLRISQLEADLRIVLLRMPAQGPARRVCRVRTVPRSRYPLTRRSDGHRLMYAVLRIGIAGLTF